VFSSQREGEVFSWWGLRNRILVSRVRRIIFFLEPGGEGVAVMLANACNPNYSLRGREQEYQV
jgi:hypothetical protein